MNPEQLEGQITEAEGAWLRRQARGVKRPVLEIGSYSGKSACCLAAGSAEGYKVRVYCVDLWHWGGKRDGLFVLREPGEPPPESKFVQREVWQTFNERLDEYDPLGLVMPVIGESVDIASRLKPKLGMLFIDGDHAYEVVRSDWEAWNRYLVPGGIVAFHDYEPPRERPEFGVKDVVRELVEPDPAWERIEAVDSIYAVRKR